MLALVRVTYKAAADSFSTNRKYRLKDEMLVDPLQHLYLLPPWNNLEGADFHAGKERHCTMGDPRETQT